MSPESLTSALERSRQPDLRGQLSQSELARYRQITLLVADALRDAICGGLSRGLSAQQKTDRTIVTRCDIEGEKAVRWRASELLPEAGVLGEEGGHQNENSPLQFVTDPVDGTLDLIRGIPTWGSVVALYYMGHPIVGVIDHPSLSDGTRICAAYGQGTTLDGLLLPKMQDEAVVDQPLIAVSAPFGFQKIGDEIPILDKILRTFPQTRMIYTCFSQSGVARGAFDAVVEWNLRLWDLASLRILIEERGGGYHEVRRHRDGHGNTLYAVVAGKPTVVRTLLDTISL